MSPGSARYLLRFDDLCPTVSAERWRRCCSLIEEFQLQPILAAVPDNHDLALAHSPPDGAFWDQLRALESAGATIGLHGYRHLCHSREPGLLGLQPTSEFAGIPAATQLAWIHEGLDILRGYGLAPRIFVAPRHGFDVNTLQALRSEGIQLLSDGFARRPFLRSSITWIPQQLWGPIEKSSGVWTICLHPNTASDDSLAQLRDFLHHHAGQFTSIDRLLAEYPPTSLTLAERICSEISLYRIRVSRAARRALRSPFRASNFA